VKWLSVSITTKKVGELPSQVVLWLSDFAKSKSQDWTPFNVSDALPAKHQLEAWEKHTNVPIPAWV